jgi:hypothetical protein
LSNAPKEGVKLPSIDLKLLHGEASKFGFSIDVIPDTSFVINDKLIEVTKESYTELLNAIKKYPTGKD